ncbi:hypothetical protein A5662_13800 [Mycobacteriaceae bacterium 1482268.1]|nr:hypothetical protein A5662_13800 [Mycobacteriaceae bacterium 1482268.1]
MATTTAVEAIGTFVLVATAGVAVLSAYPLVSVGLAVALMVVIYAAGHLAGGQFNAAVTLAMVMRGRIGLRAATMHWLAQVGGGLLAAIVVRVIVDPDRMSVVDLLLADRALIGGFVTELVSAFLLSYAVLGLTTTAVPKPSSAYDLAAGVGAIVGALSVAAMSTGALSAATVMHQLAAGLFSWVTVWVYLVGQIVAGLLAGVTFLTFGSLAHLES